MAVSQRLVRLTGDSTLMRKQAEIGLQLLDGGAGRRRRRRKYVESVEPKEDAPDFGIVFDRQAPQRGG